MGRFRAVLQNLGSSAAARLLSAAFGLVLVIYMARVWAPSRFGEYVIAFNYFQLLQQAPLLGLHFLLARDAAGQPGRLSRDLVTAGALALAAAVPLGGLLWLVGASLYPAPLHVLFLLVGLSLIPTAAILVIEMVLTGQERLSRVAQVNITEAVLRCGVFGSMVWHDATAGSLLGAFLALRWLSLALYLCDAPLRRLIDPAAFDRAALLAFLRQVPVLFAILLLSSAFSRFDVTFLSMLAPTQAVAVYSIAARLYDLALMVPSVLMMVLLPALARVHASGRGSVQAVYGLVLRYGLVFGLPAAAASGCLCGPAIRLLFGEDFAGAVLPFQLLLLAAIVTGLNQVMACILLVYDLQRLDLQCLAIGCGTLVALLAAMIPLFGIAGAALAVLASTLVQCAARAVLVRRHTGLHVAMAQVASPLIAAGAMAVVLAGLRGVPLLQLPAALAIYGLLVWVLHGVQRADFHTANALFARGAV